MNLALPRRFESDSQPKGIPRSAPVAEVVMRVLANSAHSGAHARIGHKARYAMTWSLLEQQIGLATRRAPVLNLSGGSLYPAWPVLLAAGACLGACYWIGRHLHSGLRPARDGEAIWGAIVGLGLFVAVAG